MRDYGRKILKCTLTPVIPEALKTEIFVKYLFSYTITRT
jgi:hypothetical protein